MPCAAQTVEKMEQGLLPLHRFNYGIYIIQGYQCHGFQPLEHGWRPAYRFAQWQVSHRFSPLRHQSAGSLQQVGFPQARAAVEEQDILALALGNRTNGIDNFAIGASKVAREAGAWLQPHVQGKLRQHESIRTKF